MTRYRATLAYDGTAYAGYQRQPEYPTVQGTVERAIEKVLGSPTTVWAAGRTDAGVHATGQVIAFEASWRHDARILLKAVNAYLPDDIALQDIREQADFHPRFDALSRTYRYTIAVVDVRQPLLAKRAWQWHTPLDDSLMRRAAHIVIGEHDFAAFGTPPQGNNTVRKIFRSEWRMEVLEELGKRLVYTVEATAFLYHMVRRLVGMQAAVGAGRLSLEHYEAIFHAADLSQAKHMAPPYGLSLVAVQYPDV